MKDRMITIARRLIFLTLLACSLNYINMLLMPKYSYTNSDWPTTATFEGFYDMKKNSVDVLFFGSSVAASAFNPQVIYDHNQIRSYNLSSEQQSIFLSYYWLKEALATQSPRAVVLDIKFIFPIHPESPINTSEPITRKCLDIMRFGGVKKEAVKNLCDLDASQSELSYYLTNIRFHSRWSSLDDEDFTPADYTESPLKGYAPLSTRGPREFAPLELTGSGGYAGVDPLMVDYLGRIDALCAERGIELIFTYMAEESFEEAQHNVMQAFADEHGRAFYDFSEKTCYDKVGARLRKENIVDHSNLWGSEKLSCFMADELEQRFGVAGVQDEQWEESRPFYDHIKKNCELAHTDDLRDYFNMINDPDYTVLMVVGKDASDIATDDLREGMKSVGLSDITEYGRQSYLAVVDPGRPPIEMHDNAPQTCSVSLGGGRSVCVLSSMGFYSGSTCSITVDGREVTNNEAGFHIVVYDNILKRVVETKDLP